MNLISRFSSGEQAWERYLEFSTAARTLVDQEPESWNLSDLLEARGVGRWKNDWNIILEQFSEGAKRLEALRAWQKGEITRLGFFEFATDISIFESTRALSQLADFCLQKVLEIEGAKYKTKLKEPTLAILGLGKLGGDELNYHSDIDIIFIYNEPDENSVHHLYNEWAKKIAQALTAQSAAGQMYRVDLRLRPEGDQGPLARSIESCENYYSEFGEMWERLALLKARWCAGDEECAYEFQQMIQPFCYARSMVPDLLAEISSLKERTEKEIVGDENQNYHVKLGRGGIRDIEFYVQGLQLLHGSRQPYLQGGNTLKTLDALLRLNLIEREKFHLLRSAYIFWRRVEHRLQMVDHRQTHSLPKSAESLEKIALSLDYPSGEALWDEQLLWRKKTRAIYDEFYGGLERKKISRENFELRTEAFDDAQQAMRHWESLTGSTAEFHVSRRTLESFGRLAPHLSAELSSALRPDLALTQFASFVQVYGSRSLLYESLVSNPNALKLLIRLFDASQYLGEILRSSPEIFEEVARRSLNEEYALENYLSDMRAAAKGGGDAFSFVRLYKKEQMVRVALRWLLELAPLNELFFEMSDLADACLTAGWEAIGKPKLAAISLGKHGGRQLGFGADVDLLFVGEDVRAAQEWIRFMTEKTSVGALFAVDTKLRPYAEGAVARALGEYEKYYRESAQIWEIQALTRARFSSGDEKLGEEFIQMAKNIRRKQSKRNDLKEKIFQMRQKVEEGRCKSGRPELEFKTGRGGMMDIEFMLQYWQMRENFFEPDFRKSMERFISENKSFEKIAEHYHFLRNVETWLRFDLNLSVSHLPMDEKGLRIIARRCGFDGIESFMQCIKEIREANREMFLQLLE